MYYNIYGAENLDYFKNIENVTLVQESINFSEKNLIFCLKNSKHVKKHLVKIDKIPTSVVDIFFENRCMDRIDHNLLLEKL